MDGASVKLNMFALTWRESELGKMSNFFKVSRGFILLFYCFCFNKNIFFSGIMSSIIDCRRLQFSLIMAGTRNVVRNVATELRHEEDLFENYMEFSERVFSQDNFQRKAEQSIL